MVTELDTIMIYLQKRYNIIREISRLTDELLGTVEREDVISASLVLEMRREQMERHAACEGDLMQLLENGRGDRRELHSIAFGPIDQLPGLSKKCQEEKELWIRNKIYEIRSRTQTLIEDIQKRDDRITRKVKQNK